MAIILKVAAAVVVALGGFAGPELKAQTVTAQRSCTQQWTHHGHTTQTEAKAFGRECLRRAGAVERQLREQEVLDQLAVIMGDDHPLTALVPADVGTFCAGYARMSPRDRSLFWRTMLTRMARQESAFKAAEPYWETGQGQYSIGLLQLSLSDERGYRCGLRTEVDLTVPETNLRCAVIIMTRLVSRHGRIGGNSANRAAGGAAYWSTLRIPAPRRPDQAPPRDSRREVIGATNGLTACRA